MTYMGEKLRAALESAPEEVRVQLSQPTREYAQQLATSISIVTWGTDYRKTAKTYLSETLAREHFSNICRTMGARGIVAVELNKCGRQIAFFRA